MILILVGLLLGGDPPTGEKVVAFARSRLGQTVGDGDCTALAREALRQAGAGRSRTRPGVWGEERASLRDARPGDILQFQDVVLVHRTLRGDGAIVTQEIALAHHTAIVARVRKGGARPVLVILHQNAAGAAAEARVVQEWTIDLAEKRSGTIRAYRPVADSPAGRASG